MAQVLIRELPEEVVAALKRRADRSERPLEEELRLILIEAVQEEQQRAPLSPLQLSLSNVTPASSWRRGEIYGDDER